MTWKVTRRSFTLTLDEGVVEITTPTPHARFSGDEILRLHDALGWAINRLSQPNRWAKSLNPTTNIATAVAKSADELATEVLGGKHALCLTP